MQTVLGHTPAQAGLSLLPLAAAMGAGAGLSLLAAPRLGDKLPVAAGMLLIAGAFLSLTTAGTDSGYGPVLSFQIAAGFGAGLAAAPATEAIMGAVPSERAGTGAAVNDLIREVGGALGIATIGSLLTTDSHPRTPAGHAAMPAGTAEETARAAFMSGLHTASWAAAAAALLAALIAALWLPNRTPHAPEHLPQPRTDAPASPPADASLEKDHR
ncbi:hypothetical protein ACH4U5_38230 [Streptomyces sp. NPDC020858]|uniref:hypothetical protein n=1 Tax=Streptomyces sp. NPDC020858 TaxID=3365097 RepID=UPI003799F871